MKRYGAASERILLYFNPARKPSAVTAQAGVQDTSSRISACVEPAPVKTGGLTKGSILYYLKGGEYIRPPLVQSAFNPRSIPSGVLTPTFLSKTSP